MSNFQYHAKKKMGQNPRYSFGWTDPRVGLGSKANRGLVVTIQLGKMMLTERYTLQNQFGIDFNLDISSKTTAEVERLSINEARNMWVAAYGDGTSIREVATNGFMSAVFLRLVRADMMETDGELSSLQLKEADANSPEQSAVAAY